MRSSIKGALTEIVRHLKGEILDAEVWQALAAVDDTLQPPRTFQHALYSAVIGLRLGLEAKTFAGKAEVMNAFYAMQELIARGAGGRRKTLRGHGQNFVALPRSLAFCYFTEALRELQHAASGWTQSRTMREVVDKAVSHLFRQIPAPEWAELVPLDPTSTPPTSYQNVVLHRLGALKQALELGSLTAPSVFATQFDSLVELINEGKRQFRLVRDGPAHVVQSLAKGPAPRQLITDRRARMYGIDPEDLARRWA